MDNLIWWLLGLTAVSSAAALLGLMTFLLVVWGLWRVPRGRITTIEYRWNHSSAAVLAEKSTFITNAGRFAPIELTPGETGKLQKLAGMRVKAVYIVEEPPYENAKSATHVYP